MLRHHILHNKDNNASRQPASQQRKAQEQDQLCLPRNAIAAVREAISRQPRLVDAVDDEHAQRAADAGDPVHKGNVHLRVRGVHDRLGPY